MKTKQLNKNLVRVVCYKYESVRDMLDVNLTTEIGSKVNKTCQNDVMEYVIVVDGKELVKSGNKAEILSMARHLQLKHYKPVIVERGQSDEINQ